MSGRFACALAVALAGCASAGREPERVPMCAPLASLAPLPAADECDAGELGQFTSALEERIAEDARRSLVRVELDEAAAVRSVCVEGGPGFAADAVRRDLAGHLDALLATPPGPACTAGKRLDLNRYNAKEAEIRDRETRCLEQTRVTRETPGSGALSNPFYHRELERCMDYDADWIVLDARGSTRPWIYVKPEVSDPEGPSAYDTRHRCFRKSSLAEKRAACIESEGWERLEPPPR